MKDINYDLIKLLHSKLDNVWRLEKFYCKDAKDAGCKSFDSLERILKEEKQHVDLLRKEIEARCVARIFD